MATASRSQWNMLLVFVAIISSLFIVITRVQPDTTVPASPPRSAAATVPAPRENHPAPDFTLSDLAGNPVRLSDLRGQVVLVNVWATWCPPCRAEMPILQAAYEQYRERGFIVLAINLREDARTVTQYMEQGGLAFPALLDSDGSVSDAYQARVLPSSFFIDKGGVVRAVYRGPLSRGIIGGTVEQLLAETP